MSNLEQFEVLPKKPSWRESGINIESLDRASPRPTSIPESRAKKGAAVGETVYGPHQKSCNQRDPAKASPMNPMEKGTCQGALSAYRNIGT